MSEINLSNILTKVYKQFDQTIFIYFKETKTTDILLECVYMHMKEYLVT